MECCQYLKKDQQTTHLQLKILENTNPNKHDKIIFKTDNTCTIKMNYRQILFTWCLDGL